MTKALSLEEQFVLKVSEGLFMQPAEVFYLWRMVRKRVKSIPPTVPQLQYF